MKRVGALIVGLVLAASHAQAQDLGDAFLKAQEYVRNMKERVRTSTTDPSRGDAGGSGGSRNAVADRARDAEREAERARRRAEEAAARERRRVEQEAARRFNRQERQRVAENIERLDAWLDRASSITPVTPAPRNTAPSAATIARRRQELGAVLASNNRPEYAINPSATTVTGADAINKIRIARGTEIRDAIVRNRSVRLSVRPSNAPVNANPWYSWREQEMVTRFDGWVRDATRGTTVDPDLIRAIIWMESTHGWYDLAKDKPTTVLPMNIHASFWRDLGVTYADLQRPEANIRAGVRLVEVLWRSVEQPTIEKVATIYNDLGQETVTTYGKTVAHYYATKPWRVPR